MKVFDVLGGVDVGVVGEKTYLSERQIVMVVRVVAKKSVLVFGEYDLLDDFFLLKAGDAFDSGGKVIVGSVFR